MDILYFIISSFVIFLGWIALSKRKIESINLYFYHLLAGTIFVAYSINNPSDTRSLFLDNSFENCSLLLQAPLDNSNIVYCYTYLLKTTFINNYGFLCSTFNFIGFLAINTFYNLLINFKLENKFDKYLLKGFFYLPSISFWTSINFKDSLVLLAYASLIEFIYFYREKKISYVSFLKVIITALLALLVRAYSFFFIIISLLLILTLFTINKIFTKKFNPMQVFILIVILSLLFPSFSFISNQLSITSIKSKNLKTLNLELIDTRSKLSIKNASETESYISQRGIKKSLIVFFGPLSARSINYLIESITGVFFFLIFIRAINLSLQMKFPINKPYTLFALTIILLEFTKIQVGIFNLGTAVRHRITIYLLTAFILMTISKVREHNKTSRKLKNIQNNMII